MSSSARKRKDPEGSTRQLGAPATIWIGKRRRRIGILEETDSTALVLESRFEIRPGAIVLERTVGGQLVQLTARISELVGCSSQFRYYRLEPAA